MRPNKAKRALATGGVAIGTMVFEFKTPGIAQIAATAGADFVVFDMEHTGWSDETIATLVATARGADIVPIVRVPATQYHLMSRPLDVGVMGLMIPMVETADQARIVARSAKYPPRGLRGAAFGIAHDDYQSGDIVAKMRSADDEGLIIAMIETELGVANVAEIALVDGIDVLWIGHFDLTNSMGIPGQFDHARFLAAVDRVLEAGHRHGKAVAIMVASIAEGKACLARGFRCLAYWGDLWIYQRALAEGIEAIRAATIESKPAPSQPNPVRVVIHGDPERPI
jgi:2-dehydro-3-deoxyglucarate aldolase/4-hydroxy-2-oxoheptanedioate aldolase